MTCPNKIYKCIETKINDCYSKSIRVIKLKNKNAKRYNNNWITEKIKKACEFRDDLFNQWKKDSTNKILRLKYNKARNFANKLIEKTKNQHLKKEIKLNWVNPKQLWQILNKITGRIKQSIDKIILDAFETPIVRPLNIANNFAVNFDKNVKQIIPTCNQPLLDNSTYRNRTNTSMWFRNATPWDIEKIIKSLSKKKAPGIDGIRLIDIVNLGQKVTAAIAQLINASVKKGVYPKELKIGIVRPIHKKGSRHKYDNYRPITILPTIDKIFEKFISKQIYRYYDSNKVITDEQYGFRPGKNTTQLLSKLTDKIYDHLNNKKQVLVVFIDYSKAFDSLRHDLLIDRLEDCGVRGPLLNWCKDYLMNRAYAVKVGNDFSDNVIVTEGTAQGSVLGPLHYITYVNSIINVVKECDIFQFADDTCILAAEKDVNTALQKLQTDFNNIIKWSHDSGLVLNASKTKLMYISSSHNRKQVKLELLAHDHQCLHGNANSQPCGCPHIELVDKQTHLGLIMDNRMTWKDHINHVCNKLRAILAKFSIIKHKIPYQNLLLLYNSLVESTISYGLSSYGRTFKSHLDLIYNLQLRILKTIVPEKVKIKYKDDHREIFHFCKVLPIHEKTKYHLLTENFFNTDLQVLVKHSKDTRSRRNGKLIIPYYVNNYGKRTLKSMIPRLINELPLNVKSKITTKKLKIELKQHFLETL